MRLQNTSLMLLTLVVTVINPAFADDPKLHKGKSPHGGMMQEAEGMHVEFLLEKNGEPKLFLYDKALKPLDRSDIQARLTINGHDGAQYTQVLKFTKDAKDGAHFKGDAIKNLSDWDKAVVSIKVKDSWSHFRFSHHH